VTRRAGQVRVADLAAGVDRSRRHLTRLMSDRIGTTPKLFARITRFHHAVQLARFRPNLAWGDLALEAGYADQAHLVREFRALGGVRPGDLRSPRAANIW
jgi:AraC-like DNA-binding protein